MKPLSAFQKQLLLGLGLFAAFALYAGSAVERGESAHAGPSKDQTLEIKTPEELSNVDAGASYHHVNDPGYPEDIPAL